jgi:hypothetical protein
MRGTIMNDERSGDRKLVRAGQFTRLALSCACLVQFSGPPLFGRADDIDTILTRTRQAAGSSSLKAEKSDFVIEGRSNWNDSAGTFRLRFAPSGRFRLEIQGGLTETAGFNGKTCWMVNMSGIPQTLDLFDRDLRLLWVGLQSGLWFANSAPRSMVLQPGRGDTDTVVLSVKIGRLNGQIHVSRKTWLPVMFKRSGVNGTETWTFSDYRRDRGWKVPGKIVVARPAGMTNTFEVRSLRRADSTTSQPYEPITSRPKDTRFDQRVSARLQVKRAPTGHVLVRPRIDGLERGWFIFDTGAGASVVLDRTLADKLRLEKLGALPITSFLGTTRSAILQGTSIQLGPMTLTKPLFVEMELGFIRKAMGEDIVGIVGYDVLGRCVAEITLAEDSIRLYDPARYSRDKTPWQRLTFNRSLPLVEATFEGDHKGLFRIDVGASGGAGGNVLFHTGAVETLDLLRDRSVKVFRLGPTRVAQGKIAWFELAGHRFDKPEVLFALDRQGPFGDEYVTGNLGVEFLKPFRIVLDYPHERVALMHRTEARR